MYNTEKFLDDLFTKSAREDFSNTTATLNNKIFHKVYDYVVLKSLDSLGLKREIYGRGKCIVTDIYYDKYSDCNIYRIRDIETEENYQKNQFDINIHEINGCYYSEDDLLN